MNKGLIKIIDVAKEFTDMPYGRSEVDNPEFNGVRFRREFLLKALEEYDYVEVDLTGVLGSGSSFLDEVFGGLIKYEGFTPEEVRKRVGYKSRYKSVLNNIDKYIREARPENNGGR